MLFKYYWNALTKTPLSGFTRPRLYTRRFLLFCPCQHIPTLFEHYCKGSARVVQGFSNPSATLDLRSSLLPLIIIDLERD